MATWPRAETGWNEALAAAPPEVAPRVRARALRGAGVLAWQNADYDRSRQRLEDALAAYARRSATAPAPPGRSTRLVACSPRCLRRSRQRAHFGEALAIFRTLGDAVGIAQLTANLGELAEVEGRHDLAIERLDTALAMWRDLDDRVGAARAQVYLGQALLARDKVARAETALREALTAIRDIEYEQLLPAALRSIAQVTARRGDFTVAARWYGAEAGVREALGMELPAARRAGHERAIAEVREALGEADVRAQHGRRAGVTRRGVVAALIDQGDLADAARTAKDENRGYLRAHRSRTRRAAPSGTGTNGSGDRERSLRDAPHRLQTRLRHPRQARRAVTRRGGRSRRTPWVRLTFLTDLQVRSGFLAPTVRCLHS